MSTTCSYDVELVVGDGYSQEHRVDGVVQFDWDSQRVTFYAAAGEVLAVFAASAVVSIVKDVESGEDTGA